MTQFAYQYNFPQHQEDLLDGQNNEVLVAELVHQVEQVDGEELVGLRQWPIYIIQRKFNFNRFLFLLL